MALKRQLLAERTFRPASTDSLQHQYNHFSNVYTVPNSPPDVLLSSIGVNGGVAAFFINDKFKVTPWLTLIAGLRETQFNSSPHHRCHRSPST